MEENFKQFSEIGNISCLQNCSKCCTQQHAATSMFEMLPTAEDLYNKGLMEETLKRIDLSPPECCVLASDHGCMTYPLRPSICRLFGLGRIENKKDDDQTFNFSICKVIKDRYPQKVEELKNINQLKKIKTCNQLYLPLLAQIPPSEAIELPINIALKKAFDQIALFKSYDQEPSL